MLDHSVETRLSEAQGRIARCLVPPGTWRDLSYASARQGCDGYEKLERE